MSRKTSFCSFDLYSAFVYSLSACCRIVDKGQEFPDNGAKDSGVDVVVISDETGLVVDRVVIDTALCGTEQDESLERTSPQGAGDCSSFRNGPVGGSPGVKNAVWPEIAECGPGLACVPQPRPARKKIIFTEINFDAPDLEQWIEIMNNDCMDVDLTDWSVGDTSLAGGVTPVPEDSPRTVPPGSRALFIPFNAALPSPLPVNTKIFRVGNAENGDQIGSGLNADKERIFIYDANGSIVDTVGYNCEDSNPAFEFNCDGFVAGNTLERTDASDPESFVARPPSPGQGINGFANATPCANIPS